MIQNVYVDNSDDVVRLPKRAKRLKVGDECRIDGLVYEARYREELRNEDGPYANIRVEEKISIQETWERFNEEKVV